MTTIKINMTFSMALNFIAIALAITGTLNPVAGALVLGAGIYYLAKERRDPESRKIYAIVSAVGGVIAVMCALLLF